MTSQPLKEVFICSGPKCRAVFDADPKGACPVCVKSNGAGWSTMRRDILPLPKKEEKGDAA